MGREYRLDELAEASGVRARTLRFYRERGLLQPPRREGRIAWYNDDHLARVRTVSALVERGHTLGGIAELIAAFESGRDVRGAAELLGLSTLVKPWSEETPVRLTPEELAVRFGGGAEEVSAENLADALDIGYVAVEGEEFVHVSQRLLDVSGELVKKGIPLAVVLAAGREVREHADALAELFTGLVRKHLLADVLDSPADLTPEQVARITDTIERLRPMAKQVLEAEVTMAMDRRVRTELEEWQRETSPQSSS
ncbi:MerR family transcriptional regulator [Streptomyces boninensis]|uniref:MerR family transcriptional regulator n=1 Tax=Streptomyces boninensis TaxID=2039455 RepID=UPI003B22654C